MWFILGLHTEGAPMQQALSDTGKGSQGGGRAKEADLAFPSFAHLSI